MKLDENERKDFLPLRVRFRSSQPRARNSRLQMPKKFSSGTSSPLKLLLEVPLLPFSAATPIPLSTGITAAMFHTSFSALAFRVAAPRKAESKRAFSCQINVRIKNC